MLLVHQQLALPRTTLVVREATNASSLGPTCDPFASYGRDDGAAARSAGRATCHAASAEPRWTTEQSPHWMTA
eukprot:2978215-Prymnesium_polylepis.1